MPNFDDLLDPEDFADFEDHIAPDVELPIIPAPQTQDLDPDDMQSYVADAAQEIVSHGLDAIQGLKVRALASGDPEVVENLTNLMNGTTAALDTLNKLALQVDKFKRQEQLEVKKGEIKKELINHKAESSGKQSSLTQSNIFISTRESLLEDAIHRLTGSATTEKFDGVIDVEANAAKVE